MSLFSSLRSRGRGEDDKERSMLESSRREEAAAEDAAYQEAEEKKLLKLGLPGHIITKTLSGLIILASLACIGGLGVLIANEVQPSGVVEAIQKERHTSAMDKAFYVLSCFSYTWVGLLIILAEVRWRPFRHRVHFSTYFPGRAAMQIYLGIQVLKQSESLNSLGVEDPMVHKTSVGVGWGMIGLGLCVLLLYGLAVGKKGSTFRGTTLAIALAVLLFLGLGTAIPVLAVSQGWRHYDNETLAPPTDIPEVPITPGYPETPQPLPEGTDEPQFNETDAPETDMPTVSPGGGPGEATPTPTLSITAEVATAVPTPVPTGVPVTPEPAGTALPEGTGVPVVASTPMPSEAPSPVPGVSVAPETPVPPQVPATPTPETTAPLNDTEAPGGNGTGTDAPDTPEPETETDVPTQSPTEAPAMGTEAPSSTAVPGAGGNGTNAPEVVTLTAVVTDVPPTDAPPTPAPSPQPTGVPPTPVPVPQSLAPPGTPAPACSYDKATGKTCTNLDKAVAKAGLTSVQECACGCAADAECVFFLHTTGACLWAAECNVTDAAAGLTSYSVGQPKSSPREEGDGGGSSVGTVVSVVVLLVCLALCCVLAWWCKGRQQDSVRRHKMRLDEIQIDKADWAELADLDAADELELAGMDMTCPGCYQPVGTQDGSCRSCRRSLSPPRQKSSTVLYRTKVACSSVKKTVEAAAT